MPKQVPEKIYKLILETITEQTDDEFRRSFKTTLNSLLRVATALNLKALESDDREKEDYLYASRYLVDSVAPLIHIG